MLKLLLLLLFMFTYSGTSSRSVSGKKGGNVTLSCDFEDKKISHIVLSSQTEVIGVCEAEECTGRVFKEGSCDVTMKDLRLRDAGKYFLRVYYDQTKVERLIRMYQLHIQDEISVNTGEELKLDVLLINADKVETNSSGEWTEVWTRGHGVRSDRLTDRDGNLTINAFTVNDTGTYRVLDSDGEILITITVTESERKPNSINDDGIRILPFAVSGVLVVLVVLVGLLTSAGNTSRTTRRRHQEVSPPAKRMHDQGLKHDAASSRRALH